MIVDNTTERTLPINHIPNKLQPTANHPYGEEVGADSMLMPRSSHVATVYEKCQRSRHPIVKMARSRNRITRDAVLYECTPDTTFSIKVMVVERFIRRNYTTSSLIATASMCLGVMGL